MVCVRNTQSRTLAPAEAAGRVGAVLADVGPGWAGLLLKKIDTGLRGQLGAEIDAAMDLLGIEESFVLPAIPEIGRTTQQGRQMIGGIPVHLTAFARDPQNPIADASVPGAIEATSRRRAAVIDLAAVRSDLGRAVDEARARGASVLVCDAETDADLERSMRALLSRLRPLLLVGSVGLARALRRVLGSENGVRSPFSGPAPAPGSGVLVVAGSAHPATRAQIERATMRHLIEPIEVEAGGAEAAGLVAGRLLRAGRAAALVAPAVTDGRGSAAVLADLRRAALNGLSRARPAGLVLVGGETAFHVLEGLGLPDLWLESRLSPLVVRARLMTGPWAGLALVTKGGSTGAPDILGAVVRQLGRGAI
jgi:uncharacterized protein YgbK (DUF1537 family)